MEYFHISKAGGTSWCHAASGCLLSYVACMPHHTRGPCAERRTAAAAVPWDMGQGTGYMGQTLGLRAPRAAAAPLLRPACGTYCLMERGHVGPSAPFDLGAAVLLLC